MPETLSPDAQDDSQPKAPVVACLRDGRPDWDAITFDVPCPECGYNLYALEQPRCPECGLVFNWAVLLDKAMLRSQWLFEYHWRQRPFWAFRQTVRHAMRPRRFWSGMSIHDKVRPGPLWFLAAIAQVMSVGLNAAVCGMLALLYLSISGLLAGARASADFLQAADSLRMQAIGSVRSFHILFAAVHCLVGMVVLWALLRYIFHDERHVCFAHILRVTAYNAVPLCLVGILVNLPYRAMWPWAHIHTSLFWLYAVTVANMVLGFAVSAMYLVPALRDCLGIQRPWTIAIVNCVAVLLVQVAINLLVIVWIPRLLLL